MKAYPTKDKWRILHFFWIVFCCTFITWFSFALLSILVQHDLGLSKVQLGWLITAGVELSIPGRLVVDEHAGVAVTAISHAAYTSYPGDGRIVISEVASDIRLRTGEIQQDPTHSMEENL